MWLLRAAHPLRAATCTRLSPRLPLVCLPARLGPTTCYSTVSKASAAPRSPSSGGSGARKLIRHLRRLLLNRQNAYASDIFHLALRGKRFADKDTSLICITATSLFLFHGHLREAMQAYAHIIHAGFIPPKKLRVAMDVFKQASYSPTADDIFASVQKVIEAQRPSEACLRFLLCKLCQVYKVHPTIVDQLVGLYLHHQPSGYVLSERTRAYVAYLCSRGTSTATWGRFRTDPRPAIPNAPQIIPEELIELAKSVPATPLVFSELVKRMFQDTPPDSATLKSLIYFFVKNGCFDYAFAFYGLLLETHPLDADAKVFHTMFHAVSSFSHPRTVHSRSVKKPANAPSFYDIFRSMLQCHLTFTGNRLSKQSHIVNGSVLDKMLRTFTWMNDYAAAFVTLGTFQTCGIPVTIDTYKSILGRLAGRIEREVPAVNSSQEPSHWWTYRFLGNPSLPIYADLHLVNTILTVGQEQRISLHPLPVTEEERKRFEQVRKQEAEATPQTRRQYVTPSALHLVGLAKERTSYNAIPLLRILRRAILALPLDPFVAPSAYVSQMIQERKQAMFPKTLLERRRRTDSHDVRFGSHT